MLTRGTFDSEGLLADFWNGSNGLGAENPFDPLSVSVVSNPFKIIACHLAFWRGHESSSAFFDCLPPGRLAPGLALQQEMTARVQANIDAQVKQMGVGAQA